MRSRFLLIGILATAGLSQAQSIIFQEQFDSYLGMSQKLTIASSLWVLDDCNDAQLDSGYSWSTPGLSASTWKDDNNKRLGSRVRHDLTTMDMAKAALVHAPDPTCVNGTDANPLGLQYKMHLGPSSGNVYYFTLNLYAELSCGGDRAPTPMNTVDCGYGKMRLSMIRDGDGQSHRSIALGQIAWADSDPCDVPTQQVAQMYRLVLYDGRRWNVLDAPVDMHTCSAWNIVTMTIMTNTINISIESRYNPATGQCDKKNTYTTTISRDYLGPFTSLKFGGIPKEGGGCWGEDNSPAGAYPSQPTYMDDIYLYDGEALDIPNPCQTVLSGACCKSDKTCSVITQADCLAAEGVYKGDGTACGPYACCPPVWPDADDDDDVDQVDFGQFQLCFTGPVKGVIPACVCFDRNLDDDVDQEDFIQFSNCFTGPAIPLDVDNPPSGCSL